MEQRAKAFFEADREYLVRSGKCKDSRGKIQMKQKYRLAKMWLYILFLRIKEMITVLKVESMITLARKKTDLDHQALNLTAEIPQGMSLLQVVGWAAMSSI